MKIIKTRKGFFPDIKTCIYYSLASLTFCYIYFHKLFHTVTFYEHNMGGIYYILSYEANVPNQYRLLIPYVFKIIKTVFPFLNDRAVYMSIILVITFLTLVVFYNILNVYFSNEKINKYLAFILLFPMAWQYIILNNMFEFTDFANILFILSGYYLIIKGYNKTLLLVFAIGTLNHDSIGFLILMYLFFHYREIFTKRVIFNTAVMAAVIIGVKLTMMQIFKNNPNVSFRTHYVYNLESFVNLAPHRVIRDILLFFGGLHFFVLYFYVSGRWKYFRTRYLYISFVIIPYVIILFLIHTTLEARNYITAIQFIIIPFLLLLSTFKDSFLKPSPEVLSDPDFYKEKTE